MTPEQPSEPDSDNKSEVDKGDIPTTETRRPNISTEHQEGGDARKPSDTLDRDRTPPQDDGGRKSSFT